MNINFHNPYPNIAAKQIHLNPTPDIIRLIKQINRKKKKCLRCKELEIFPQDFIEFFKNRALVPLIILTGKMVVEGGLIFAEGENEQGQKGFYLTHDYRVGKKCLLRAEITN